MSDNLLYIDIELSKSLPFDNCFEIHNKIGGMTMKKITALLLSLTLMLSLVACSDEATGNPDESSPVSQTEENKGNEDTSNDDVEESTTPQQPQENTEKEVYSVAMFDELMSTMPVAIVSSKYIVQDDEYKSLYPDMLQAVIKNDTQLDIKDVVVAFIAWDENNLPVKIKGSMDFSDGDYIKQVNYADINLAPNSEFGHNSGFEVDENNTINTFKAVVVSYVAFDGTEWENPYYGNFTELYEGEKYSDDLSTEIEIVDIEQTVKASSDTFEVTASVTITELDELIKAQDIAVIDTKYVVQDEQYKSLYPDMLQVVIKNNTQLDIKNAVVAYAAWDKNSLPVKIKGSMDFSDGTYIKLVNFTDINLVPDAEYGHNSGYEVEENNTIQTFKAIVVSYEAFDGSTWENPQYDDFIALYEGIKLQ